MIFTCVRFESAELTARPAPLRHLASPYQAAC